MTECERIIASGLLPADYLKEEVLCEFRVDTERKKLWMILLDMLVLFDKVCRKHGLKYYLMGGSLLGAVRHQGFIPWDDDLDVCMLREDYDKLIEIGPREFQDPYFFQTPYTDPGYGFSFIKIRNNNTTGMSTAFRYEKFNQGMFLDVFPLDNYVPGTEVEIFTRINALNLENSTAMRLSNPNPPEKDRERIARHCGRDPIDVYEEIQRIARQYEAVPTDAVTCYVCTIYKTEKYVVQKSDLEKSIDCKFEGLDLQIPAGYDRILRTMFGDYMQFPPVEKRGVWHDGIFAADIPYKEYAKRFTAEK